MWTAKVLSTIMLLLVLLARESYGAKILVVFPFPAPSHLILASALIEGLAEKGHEVTAMVPQKINKNAAKYREIAIGIDKSDLGMQPNLFEMDELPIFITMLFMWGMGSRLCDLVINKPHIQEFIHSKDEHYDAVIIESFFHECLLGFSHKFQAPIIQICPFGGGEWVTAAVGSPHNYAYMPDFMTSYTQHMSFFQKVHNTAIGLYTKLVRRLYYIPKQNAIMQKGFAGTGPGPLPHVSELDFNTSLILMNQHLSLSYPRPLMPNAVEVGGLQIKPPKKLPKDLQDFLDSAKEGLVYFSMGSNLKSVDLPVAKRDALLRAFSKLKLKVLWKWEDDNLPGLPQNVKLGKWLPQSDLLAHPNVKLFITHGGLLSTQESVYHGVPVIGIPIFGDQKMNIMGAVAGDYGYFLDFRTLDNEELISKAINTVLDDPKYRRNVQLKSRALRDQPLTPLETAIFWIEYVIRHKGAAHMRSGALDLTWYQYYLLDVLAVLAGGLLVTLAVFALLLKTLYLLAFKKKPAVKESKKKN